MKSLVSWAAARPLSDWLAVYGAALSTALGVASLRRRSRVAVQTELDQAADGLVIRVVNRSDYPVTVCKLEFAKRRWCAREFSDVYVERRVEAHGQTLIAQQLEALYYEHGVKEGVVLSTRVRVTLSTGEMYWSKRTKDVTPAQRDPLAA